MKSPFQEITCEDLVVCGANTSAYLWECHHPSRHPGEGRGPENSEKTASLLAVFFGALLDKPAVALMW